VSLFGRWSGARKGASCSWLWFRSRLSIRPCIIKCYNDSIRNFVGEHPAFFGGLLYMPRSMEELEDRLLYTSVHTLFRTQNQYGAVPIVQCYIMQACMYLCSYQAISSKLCEGISRKSGQFNALNISSIDAKTISI
jgi:hypothetical protein